MATRSKATTKRDDGQTGKTLDETRPNETTNVRPDEVRTLDMRTRVPPNDRWPLVCSFLIVNEFVYTHNVDKVLTRCYDKATARISSGFPRAVVIQSGPSFWFQCSTYVGQAQDSSSFLDSLLSLDQPSLPSISVTVMAWWITALKTLVLARAIKRFWLICAVAILSVDINLTSLLSLYCTLLCSPAMKWFGI